MHDVAYTDHETSKPRNIGCLGVWFLEQKIVTSTRGIPICPPAMRNEK